MVRGGAKCPSANVDVPGVPIPNRRRLSNKAPTAITKVDGFGSMTDECTTNQLNPPDQASTTVLFALIASRNGRTFTYLDTRRSRVCVGKG